MTRIKLLIICLILFSMPSKADEGMWLPSLLKKYNIEDMKKAGFKLSAEDVYDINKICLKDAVVGLGRSNNPTTFSGSGSFISSTGLVLTNHHCAVSYLHKHSTTEKNYIKDGFYASSPEMELPAKGLTLSRLVRMEDVTCQLKEGTEFMNERQTGKLLKMRGKKVADEATKNTNYKAKIKPYFGGAQYFLEVYEVYADVRIVAMPPLSVGKFGGETDNWQWPRQSADFCILRVYGDSTNQSLKYSASNTPIEPTNSLDLSLKGYEEDDFAMVFGFPASTKQFLTARALKQLVEVTNFHSIKIRDAKMEIINKNMSKSDDLWLKYADVKGKTSNSLLRWKAESAGIERFDIIKLKQKQEAEFTQWVNATDERKQKYEDLIPGIESFCMQLDTLEKLNAYVNEAGISGAKITSFVAKFEMLNAISSRTKINEKRLNKELRRMRVEVSNFFQDFDVDVEKELLEVMVRLYDENVGDSLKPAPIVEARKKYQGDFKTYMDDVFEQSVFTSEEKLSKFLNDYTQADVVTIQKDPLFNLCLSYYLINQEKLYRQRIDIRHEYGKYHQRYVQAVREMKASEKLSPDANRTLRVSYGKVKGLNTDDTQYSHQTSLESLVQKNQMNPKVYPLPDGFAELCRKEVALGKNKFSTCFITNAHTTGGNSGSPVLNKKGKLIGLNFDRVGYGLVSDYTYLPEVSRQISVDIRYVRFVLEHQLKAKALLEEWK
ncbi:S46 family peptidase [Ancylomarina sp.]|uniref:S46 family peptidase n=1 Tax=Ancylomarina sp. TaxID=1970196 RepID=UPI003563A7CB